MVTHVMKAGILVKRTAIIAIIILAVLIVLGSAIIVIVGPMVNGWFPHRA
jgi:hypothetical protein